MSVASIPGVELDFEHGMIRLGLHRFPACIELWHRGWLDSCDGVCERCQAYSGCPAGAGYSRWGDDWSRGWSVVVPLENRARIWVNLEEHSALDGSNRRLVLDLNLGCDARHPAANRAFSDETSGNIWVGVMGDHLHASLQLWGQGRCVGTWNDCEPEWAAELIARISRMDAPNQIEGSIPSGLVPISDPRVRPVCEEER